MGIGSGHCKFGKTSRGDLEEQRKAERQHRERLEEGVTSSIEQKKLIEEQVGILYEQNRLLSENYEKVFFLKVNAMTEIIL